MWLVLSPPSHLQLIAKGRIDECGVKRNSPKGRLALNTVIGFHRIIVIVVVIIVLFILHILHIAQRVSGLTWSELQISAFFLFSNFRKRQIALYSPCWLVGRLVDVTINFFQYIKA